VALTTICWTGTEFDEAGWRHSLGGGARPGRRSLAVELDLPVMGGGRVRVGEERGGRGEGWEWRGRNLEEERSWG
jgi:hypothetical protein